MQTLEIQLEDDTVAAVKYYAAKRGTSVSKYLETTLSRLVPQYLGALDREATQRAKRRGRRDE